MRLNFASNWKNLQWTRMKYWKRRMDKQIIMNSATFYRWYNAFKDDREVVDDEPREGCPAQRFYEPKCCNHRPNSHCSQLSPWHIEDDPSDPSYFSKNDRRKKVEKIFLHFDDVRPHFTGVESPIRLNKKQHSNRSAFPMQFRSSPLRLLAVSSPANAKIQVESRGRKSFGGEVKIRSLSFVFRTWQELWANSVWTSREVDSKRNILIWKIK